MNKHNIFVWGMFIIGSLLFILPFISFMSDKIPPDFISTLVVSLSFLGDFAAMATLAIAVLLYDKFGLRNKLIEKQAEEVLELVSMLKAITFTVKGRKCTYFVQPNRSKLGHISEMYEYRVDSPKQILISEQNYENALSGILTLSRSHWMPQKIKEKMKFFDIPAIKKIKNILNDEHVKMSFSGVDDRDSWGEVVPPMTFKEFNVNLYGLVEEIDIWLKKHADTSINFFNERNF